MNLKGSILAATLLALACAFAAPASAQIVRMATSHRLHRRFQNITDWAVDPAEPR